MAISYETYLRLLEHEIPTLEQARTPQDTILYALSVGVGFDPVDPGQLRFLYEADLVALPTMAAVICMPYGWIGRSGLEFGTRSVQAEQTIELHRPVPVRGHFVGTTRVVSVVDKGPGRGALVTVERKISESSSGECVATMTATSYCRGDGGFGGPTGPVRAPHPIPQSPPHHVCDLPTLPQLALMYRLHGDPTPLHADPAFARRAGFPRPILHGLCSMGVACHAIVRTLCGYRPEAVQSMECRFAAPVYPGETLRTEMWQDGRVISFRTVVPERGDTVVIDHGRVVLA